MVLTPNLADSILPLFFTVMLANVWILPGSLPRVLGVGLFGALTLFTGYGFCGAPVTAGLALLLWLRSRRGNRDPDRRTAVPILGILGVATIAFAWGYHWDRGTHVWGPSMPDWWDYPRFCALMFTSLLGLRPVYAATLLHGTVAGAISPFVRQVVSAALAVVGAVRLVLVVSVFLAAGPGLARAGERPGESRVGFVGDIAPLCRIDRGRASARDHRCGVSVAVFDADDSGRLWARDRCRGDVDLETAAPGPQPHDRLGCARRRCLVQRFAREKCRRHRQGEGPLDRKLPEDAGSGCGEQGVGLCGRLSGPRFTGHCWATTLARPAAFVVLPEFG